MKHCSKILSSKLTLHIQCVHCKDGDYVTQGDSGDFDIEEITCWSCGKDSLVGEETLYFYPAYPDESVGGHFDGKSEPDHLFPGC